MNLHILAVGTLIADPVRRTGQSGKDFATGNIRVQAEDDSVLISVIAFGDAAQQLLEHRQSRCPAGPNSKIGRPRTTLSGRVCR